MDNGHKKAAEGPLAVLSGLVLFLLGNTGFPLGKLLFPLIQQGLTGRVCAFATTGATGGKGQGSNANQGSRTKASNELLKRSHGLKFQFSKLNLTPSTPYRVKNPEFLYTNRHSRSVN